MASVLLKILPCLLFPPKLIVSYPQNAKIFEHPRRPHYLQELYRSYSVCVIHIVDLIGNLEPAQQAQPIIFDVWTKELESLRNLSGLPVKFNQRIETIAQDRTKGQSAISKLNHVSCFVTFILALKNSFLESTFSRFSREVDEPVRIFLRQDFTLAWETPWDKSGVQQRYLNVPPMYFPESVVILCDDHFDLSTIQSLDGPWADLDLRLFYPSAAHIPTIVLIGLESAQLEKSPSFGTEPCDVAFLFCTHCDPNKSFIPISCTSAIRTAESEASKYVEVVPWLAFDGTYYWKQKVTPCPFTLGTAAKEICTAEYVNIKAIVFAYMNTTVAGEAWVNRHPDLRFPEIASDSDLSKIELIASQKSLQFGLITSDGVYLPTGSISSFPLLQPFNKHVWIWTVIAIVGVAFSVTGLLHSNYDPLKSFFLWTYSAGAALLAQAHTPVFRTRETWSTSLNQRFERKIKFLWILWLLSAIFLTSSYNAAFNSNYIIEPEYSRNWTGGLLAMKGFTIILAFDDPPLDDVREFLIQDHYLSGKNCYDFYDLVLGRDSRHSCSFVHDYIEMQENRFIDLSHKDREKLIKIHGNFLHLVPMELLKKTIETRLTMPKTVFVSPLEYLNSDWELFREQMRDKKALKFSWHFDKGETPLRAIKSYGITKGLQSWHYNLVPRRLRTIVSNGILGLWRKWANFRLKFRQYRNAAGTQKERFRPLSLQGSDLCLVFLLFVLCLVICFGAFVTEIFFWVKHMRRTLS